MSHYAIEKLRKLIVNIKPKTIHNLGCLSGAIVYILVPRYRYLVQANIHFAFPAWNEGRVKQCALRVFQNYAMVFMETLQIALCRTTAEVRTKVDFGDMTDEAIFEKLKHQSIINISAHIGNWEAALQSGTAKWGLPTSVVVQKIHNKRVNRFFENFRGRWGIQLIYKRDAVKNMRHALQNHRFLILLVDQSRIKNGIPVTFFGKKTYSTTAVATLALRFKIPVYAVYCVRDNAGQLHFRYTDEIRLERSGDLKADISAYTQKMQDVLETIVRAYPEQWFWFHKRWRYDYPEIYRKGPVFGRFAKKRNSAK